MPFLAAPIFTLASVAPFSRMESPPPFQLLVGVLGVNVQQLLLDALPGDFSRCWLYRRRTSSRSVVVSW